MKTPMLKYPKAFRNLRHSMTCWRTCPNCNQQIDIELALRLSGWSQLAPSKFGLKCPNCKMILAARQRPGMAVYWCVFAVVVALGLVGIATGHLTRPVMLVAAAGLGVYSVLMQRWRLKSLIELDVPPPGVELREIQPSAKEYDYLEGRGVRDKVFRVNQASAAVTGPEWICSNCKRSNPDRLMSAGNAITAEVK
jgi:hypothetical protein